MYMATQAPIADERVIDFFEMITVQMIKPRWTAHRLSVTLRQ